MKLQENTVRLIKKVLNERSNKEPEQLNEFISDIKRLFGAPGNKADKEILEKTAKVLKLDVLKRNFPDLHKALKKVVENPTRDVSDGGFAGRPPLPRKMFEELRAMLPSPQTIRNSGGKYTSLAGNFRNQITYYYNSADGKSQDLVSLGGMGGSDRSVSSDNKRRAANQQRADRRVMNPADRGRRPRFRDV
jgi:hypothetical protein